MKFNNLKSYVGEEKATLKLATMENFKNSLKRNQREESDAPICSFLK
jgi:hypothetical protein